MSFKEGDLVEGEICPKCGKSLVYEMSFRDMFSDKNGHYTVDVPMKVCCECDYSEEICEEEPDYEPSEDDDEVIFEAAGEEIE